MKRLLGWLCCLWSVPLLAVPLPVLHLYGWHGLLPDATVERFERHCQCRVDVDYFSSNEEMNARLVAGAGNLDLVFPPSYGVPGLLRARLLRPLDRSRLSNFANLQPVLLNPAYDPGNVYTVPVALSLISVGYNIEKLRQLNVDPYSWSVIFDPRVLARLRGRVTVLDHPRQLFAAALMYLGRDPNAASDEDLRRARDLIAAARPYWTGFSGDHADRALADGEVWVSLGSSMKFYQAREEAKRLHRPFTIGWVLQREGNELSEVNMAVPATAPHPELAERFINFLLAGRNAADLSNVSGATNPVRTALPYFRDDLQYHPLINPDPSALRKWVVLRELPPRQQHKLYRLWSEIRTTRAPNASGQLNEGRLNVRQTGPGEQ